MQFSESWLRSFVNPALTTEELAHRLTMQGLEVEDVQRAAPPFSGVVVAQVLAVSKHPDADRLNVCQVDVGTGQILNIVCGAPNVAVGIKVPCALVGAQLPPVEGGDGQAFVIKLGKLRGVESQGMLCSARELKLSDDQGGLLILPEATVIGASIRDVLDLDDHVLTLKLTPNKADCLSILGVAREVAAMTGAALAMPAYAAPATQSTEQWPVKISAPDLCGRFCSRVIRGVDAKAPTPEWMKQRLARGGQRSISVLVDISNYVMLELGQPTHLFDLAKIQGDLEVRWGRAGETLTLLNGHTITIDANVGVVADAAGLVSLAGIMGGERGAVSLDTTDVLIESAFWFPQAIQGRARRYNFSTDAAHRFERGVDHGQTAASLERLTALIVEICGGEQTSAATLHDQVVNVPSVKPVRMRIARAAKVIGVDISAERIAAIFASLNFDFVQDAESFIVTAPSYRFDIEIEEDLIEEVARCYGFENIPARLPVAQYSMRNQPESLRDLHAIREQLAACDYQETLNYSFVEADWEHDFAGNAAPIKLLNPIASQLSVMRSSLIASLVANVRFNLNRKATRVRLFEIAKVYRKDAAVQESESDVAGFSQPMRIAAIAYGPVIGEQWGALHRMVDFFDVKRDLETLFGPALSSGDLRFEASHQHPALHPGRCARIQIDGKEVGWIGELHPRWLQKYELTHAPVVFEADALALQQRALPQVTEISKFPMVYRDLALVFDQTIPAQQAIDAIDRVRRNAQASDQPASRIDDVSLFDEYRGKGLKDNEKSLAFRFRLKDTKQTLNDQMIDAALAQITETLRADLGATLRS